MLSDFFVAVISSAAVSLALCGMLLWLTKTWISERLKNAIKAEYDIKLESHKAQLKSTYDEKLETHKVQLKSQADVEVERLKSSLSVIAAEQNTKFGKLHERRVQVIADTYSRLKKLHDCLADYVKPFEPSGGPSREERRRLMVTAFDELRPYFSQNQIFLPKKIAELIQKAEMEMVQIANLFTYTVDLQANPDAEKWLKITERFNYDVKQALSGLEDEMRVALGDKG
jgi:hypothetical protein